MNRNTQPHPERSPRAARAQSRSREAEPDGRRVSLEEPLLDCAGAAQLLGVRVSWVRDAARMGQLPCLRVGRHLRFSRAMLEAWLAGRVGEAPETEAASVAVARRGHAARIAARRRGSQRALLAALDDDPARGNHGAP